MQEQPDNGVHVPRDAAPPRSPAEALSAAVAAHNADPVPKGMPTLAEALATVDRDFEARPFDEKDRPVLESWVRLRMATQERISAEQAWVGDPIPMILHCPQCNRRHIDAGSFASKAHVAHSCQYCGTVWRPAINPTLGVAALPGFRNANVCPGPLPELAADVVAALDPDIRGVVVWLRGHGFDTVDSGDGHTKFEAGASHEDCTIPEPNVAISVEFDRLHSEGDRLWFLLGGHPPDVLRVQASYDPGDRTGILLVTGPGLLDTEMLASGHARYMRVFPSVAAPLAGTADPGPIDPSPQRAGTIDIVFDGPPGHEGGRFVEVEDARGHSIKVGTWVDRGDGQWALRLGGGQ